MIINITILEDNESDFITLSDSIKKWAANTGILINIIWLNSYKKFIKSLPTLHIPQELRIRSRGTERHSASN